MLVFVSITRYSCRIFSELEFFRHFSRSAKISNFLKISPLGAELFHADGQTGMTKLTVGFRNFVNAPKKK